MAFFNKEKGKTAIKQNVIQGALEDAGAALKDDPLQEAVQKKKPLTIYKTGRANALSVFHLIFPFDRSFYL